MDQMILAILLARATAASLRGLRSSNCSSHAEADLLPGLAQRMTDMAPTNNNCRILSLPALLILPMRCLPPVECSFGVRPSQAAKCRPDAKFPGSTVRAMVIAPSGPTPGIASSEATEFRYERGEQPQPRIGPWREVLDEMLASNEAKPRRERLTLIRIFEAL